MGPLQGLPLWKASAVGEQNTFTSKYCPPVELERVSTVRLQGASGTEMWQGVTGRHLVLHAHERVRRYRVAVGGVVKTLSKKGRKQLFAGAGTSCLTRAPVLEHSRD